MNLIKLENGMHINLDKIVKLRQQGDDYYIYLGCDCVVVSESDYWKIISECKNGHK